MNPVRKWCFVGMGFAFVAIVFSATMMWTPRPQIPAPKEIFAHEGEWVTSAVDGSKICRIAHDIYKHDATDQNFCADWTVPPAKNGDPIPTDGTWVRANKLNGVQLHVGDEWR